MSPGRRDTCAARQTRSLGASARSASGMLSKGKGGRMVTALDNKTIEQNKATARRWSEELWGQGKLEVADEIVAPDYQRHDPGDPFPARGPEDVKRIVRM